MKPVIETNNLKKYYTRGSETVKALDDVDFKMFPGEIISIVEPSGSGKSTFLNLISCLDSPTSGKIEIGGIDVTNLTESELIKIRQDYIGFIFQKAYLIPNLTAKENIRLPLIFSGKNQNGKWINSIIQMVGLSGKENIPVNMLSGGDKQRIAIARALINNPKVIIADEPTSRLEIKMNDILMDIFINLAKKGIAIFIATHDLDFAQECQKVLYLQDGKIIPKHLSSLILN